MNTIHYLHIHGLVLLASTLTYGMELSNKMNLHFITHPVTQAITSIEQGETSLFDPVHEAVGIKIRKSIRRKIARADDFGSRSLDINYACYEHIGTPSFFEMEQDPTLAPSDTMYDRITDLETSNAEIIAQTDQSITAIRSEKRPREALQAEVQDALDNNRFDRIEGIDDFICYLRQKQSLNELNLNEEALLERYLKRMNFMAKQYLPLVSHKATFNALKTNAANRVASLGIQKNKAHNDMRTLKIRQTKKT